MQRARKRRWFNLGTIALGLGVSLIVFSVALPKEEFGWDFGFIDQMELKALDLKFLDRGPVPPHDEVVIAAIDEKSIERYGRWPWNRVVIAQLIAALAEKGAAVVAFDVGFTDADDTKLPVVFGALAEQIDSLEVPDCSGCEPMREATLKLIKEEMVASDPDRILADVIRKAGNVILGFFIFTNPAEIAHLDRERLAASLETISASKVKITKPREQAEEKNYILNLGEGYGVRAPLPMVAEAAAGFGHFTFKPDTDGALRWGDLLWEIQTGEPGPHPILPSLSLATVAHYLDREIVMHTYSRGVDGITLGLGADKRTLITDPHGRLLINYHGPQGTYPTYPIADILDGRIPPERLKGKIVLVGATAIALYDLRTTPFQENMAGVEVHANLIDNILHDDHISRPDWAVLFELGIILLFGLVFGVVLGLVPALWGALFIVFVVFGFLTVDKYLFFAHGYWMHTVLPLSEAFVIFLFCYVYRYMTEEREKKRTRAAFKQYLNESVVEHVMSKYGGLKLGGEKREISVLFSDIRGFTTLSETLSPEELGNMLTEYLNPMTEIVLQSEGVLDKYMGDAIMAFWGAPHPQEDHALRACRTALAMIRELDRLNELWRRRGIPRLAIGVGVNTGAMWVGNMGSSLRFDYTVIGDAVNLGSRLEGTNKQYGTSIIVSEFTYVHIKDRFLCRRLDSIRVKGKHEPVTIYELVAEGEGAPKERLLCERFNAGLTLYRAQKWDEAKRAFHDVLLEFPDDEPSRAFVDRCEEYKETPPPPDWDGVYVMTTK
ncbi:MAG: CHASE2 domain-containing protein [Myxococcales bacterium]|nr:MAG: CHASE2 domain-containing protein [Myxococcales bacterium]